MILKTDSTDRFLDLNPLPTWIYDIETLRVLEVNKAATKFYGYTRAEFLKLSLIELRPDDAIPIFMDFQKDIEKHIGNVDLGVFDHIKKNGEVVRMSISGHKIEFQDHHSILVVCQDVTEQERQIQLLKASDQKLKAVSTIAKIGYWRLELDANTLSWTDQIYDIWGLEKGNFELDYDHFLKTIHPQDLHLFEKAQHTALQDDADLDHIYRIILPDGHIRWVHEFGRLLKDSHGQPIGFEGTSQDVTNQIEEQQQLKLLKNVVTNTNDAVLIAEVEPDHEKDAHVIYVNEAFTEMTGYTADEVIGQSPRILEGPNSDKRDIEKFRKALRNWEKYDVTILNYKKNGDEFWNHFSFSPVANEKDQFTHWVAILRDVSTQKLKELESQFSNQISTDFSSNKSYQSATTALCKTVGAFGNFDLVELWLVDLEKNYLQLYSHYVMDTNDEALYADKTTIPQFQISQGLVGKVWQAEKQFLWKNFERSEHFIRNEFAEDLGLKSVLGIPLISQKKVIGVLAIGSKSNRSHLKKYSATFKKMEHFIGSEVCRKKIEHDLAYLYDSVPDIICTIDYQGKVLKINNAGYDIMGVSHTEFLYRKFEDFVHKEDRLKFLDCINRTKHTQTICNIDIRVINGKGEKIWLNWTCDPSVENHLLHVIAKNITKEKKPLELSREASTMAKVGSWEVDLVHNKIYWSEVIHDLYGTDPESFHLDLESIIGLYRSDFQDMVTIHINKCIHTGQPFVFEAVLVTTKKQERWVRVKGEADFADGLCKRIYGSFQDIHHRKEAESRLQSLADNLPGVVFKFSIAPDGTELISHLTKGAEQVLGYSAELIEKNNDLVWDQIEAGGNLQEVKDSIIESVTQHKKWSCRWKYIMPNGELKTLVGYGTPNYLADGTVVSNSLVLDITQEAKTEELLKQATHLAQIGSWEIDLDQQNNETIYWSPIVKEILELDESYDPSPTRGLEFCSAASQIKMQKALDNIIASGKDFDEELLVKTASGNEKWIRCIGESVILNNKNTEIHGSFQDITKAKLLELQIFEILESISDAFYAVDKNWKITYFNKEAERLLNRNESEVMGVSLWSAFPEAVDTPLEAIYKRVIKSKKSESFEYLFPENNHWYDINVYASNDGLSVYFKNINERKQAAIQLKNALDEKITILESIGDGFYTVNKAWHITYWNKQAELIFGLSRAEVIGRHLWEVFPDATASSSYKLFHKAMETGNAINHEEYYANRWLGITVYPSDDGLSIYFKDITLKKEGDQRLLLANERFEKATEATNDAIWDWDFIENTHYWGVGFKKLFGYDVDHLAETVENWTAHIHPDDQKRVVESLHHMLYHTEINNWGEEYRYQNSDGTYSNVLNKGLILRTNGNEPHRMVGAITDITALKKQEEELTALNSALKTHAQKLERSNEELEQFAYISSHDLEEPLRMITSFMDLLKKKYGDQLDDKAQEYIHYASDGAKRMKQIMLNLLQYSKAMNPIESVEKVDMENLLSEYKLLRRKIISKKRVTIKSDKLPVTTNRKAALTNILHTLLDNAIKYSKEDVPPVIHLKVKEKTDRFEFSVKDNGIGIENQHFEKVFVMFQRLHNRDQYEGTGVGLSIAKRNVEFLGGQMWLESVSGEGSTFYFTLPKIE